MPKTKRTPADEMVYRIGKYKKAPSLAALRTRFARVLDSDVAIENLVRSLLSAGRIRVTNKVFHLPTTKEST